MNFFPMRYFSFLSIKQICLNIFLLRWLEWIFEGKNIIFFAEKIKSRRGGIKVSLFVVSSTEFEFMKHLPSFIRNVFIKITFCSCGNIGEMILKILAVSFHKKQKKVNSHFQIPCKENFWLHNR